MIHRVAEYKGKRRNSHMTRFSKKNVRPSARKEKTKKSIHFPLVYVYNNNNLFIAENKSNYTTKTKYKYSA